MPDRTFSQIVSTLVIRPPPNNGVQPTCPAAEVEHQF
jgi:hypothetical protein